MHVAFQLASYVPHHVLRHYVCHPTSLTFPHSEHFPAAVLFADLSGFTPLAERLSKLESGVAQLTALINDVFDPLLAIITEYGGDVVKVSFVVWSIPRFAKCQLCCHADLWEFRSAAWLTHACRSVEPHRVLCATLPSSVRRRCADGHISGVHTH